MAQKKEIQYWIDISEYDLETSKAMLSTGRFLYVGFMCQQVVEKILKAHFQKKNNQHPPKTHNLRLLAEETGFWSCFTPVQKDLLLLLEPLNIEARYPNYKEQLLKTLDEKKCRNLIENTEDLFKWLKEKL